VELRAKNIGSEPEYFEGRNQVLMDTGGKMYRYDVSASSGFDWLEPVNPGNEVQGVLAFDVPAGFELSHLLVNGEGSFADGVRVDVDERRSRQSSQPRPAGMASMVVQPSA